MAEPNLRRQWRHVHGDRWHRAKEVKKRTEVETPWGIAMAEIGTYTLTCKTTGDMVIVTLEDLQTHWTNEPIPAPPKPEPPILGDPTSSPFPLDLPGRKNGA